MRSAILVVIRQSSKNIIKRGVSGFSVLFGYFPARASEKYAVIKF
jgi:hypothetical protein